MGHTSTVSRASTRTSVYMAHLSRRFAEGCNESMTSTGLRQRHIIALSYLSRFGPVPQQELVEALRIDPSNVVALLNELEDDGLVVRRRDPADRRRHIVELVPAGEQALGEILAAVDAIEDRILESLSDDERRTLHDLLERAADGQLPACHVDLSD